MRTGCIGFVGRSACICAVVLVVSVAPAWAQVAVESHGAPVASRSSLDDNGQSFEAADGNMVASAAEPVFTSGPNPLSHITPIVTEQITSSGDGLRALDCQAFGDSVFRFPGIVNFFQGEVISVPQESTLGEFSVELDFTGPQLVTFAVYRRNPLSGEYETEAGWIVQRALTGTGRGFYSSGALNIPLTLDMLGPTPTTSFYSLGVGWTTPAIDFWQDTETYPQTFQHFTVQGYWGFFSAPPAPTNLSPRFFLNLFQGGAISMDICVVAAPGACCKPDDSCEVVFDADACDVLGGEFTAAGVQCDPDLCPLPRGACCIVPDTCDFTNEFLCLGDRGGFSWEQDRNCSPFNPCAEPVGACCMPDGSCADEMLQSDCENQDGIYNGDFSLCADPGLQCVTRGACCLPQSGCDVRTESECIISQGAYSGDGTHCFNPPFTNFDPCDTTPGACCFYDGSCVTTSGYFCEFNSNGTRGNWTPGATCEAALCDEQVQCSC